MKRHVIYIFIVLLVATAVSILAEANDQATEAIEIACDFYNDDISMDKREDCMLQYLRCAYGTDGKKLKLEFKDLIKCTKESSNEI